MTRDPVAEHRKVADMAYALGIALYLGEDGHISQNGPGELIEPARGATPNPHGHGKYADATPHP